MFILFYFCLLVSASKGHHQANIYLLTPRRRVLLDKLTGLQLVKKFPTFHGTRRFITALTSLRQPSLSWASQIQSIYPHPTSWRSTLILSIHLHLGLPSGLFPSGFPDTRHMPSPSHSIMRPISTKKNLKYNKPDFLYYVHKNFGFFFL